MTSSNAHLFKWTKKIPSNTFRVSIPQLNAADQFEAYWRMLAPKNAPLPRREYVFAKGRHYRFDFAWPTIKITTVSSPTGGGYPNQVDSHSTRAVAVEIEGGLFIQGGHVRGAAYERNLEKYNLATTLGWRLLRFSPGMLERNPGACIAQVVRTLGGRS